MGPLSTTTAPGLDNRLLLHRVQVGLFLAAFANFFFAIGEWVSDPPRELLWVRALAALGTAGLILLARTPSLVPWARLVGFVAATFVCAMVAASGMISAQSSTTMVPIVVLMLGSAALLPWGGWSQACLAAVVAATIVFAETLSPGAFFTLGDDREWMGLLAAAVVSISIAHQLDRHRLRLELILQSTAEGICGIDTEGRCTFVNAAGLQILGCADGEPILGRHMHALFHHSDAEGNPYPEERCPISESLRWGRAGRRDGEVFWRKDGTAFPVEYSVNPILENGRVRGAVVAFADITLRREAERTRRDLVAMLSHDIKNPLSVVLGLTELLRDDPPESEDDRRHSLDDIEVAARKALGLAVNFVDATRAQSGALRIVPVPGALNDVVLRAVRDQASTARVRRITFTTELADGLPKIPLDEAMFERVVGNLLSNAVRYSPKDSVVTIRTAVAGNEALLSVADRGPGIALADRAKLFRRFSQVGRSSKNSSGLGLFIVKTIVDGHGGRVALECPPEGGSTFIVALPLSSNAGPAADDGVEAESMPPMVESAAATAAAAVNLVGPSARTIAERSDDSFRKLAHSIDEVLFLVDKDLQHTRYVSPAFEKVYGRPCQTVYEKPLSFLELIHPDDVERVRATLADFEHGEASVDYRIVREDGATRWIRVRLFPVCDESGEASHVAGIAADITDLRAAHAENERLALIVESASDAIFALSADRKIVSWNPGAELLFGYSAAEMLGRPWEILRSEDDQADEGAFERVMSGQIVRSLDARRVTKDRRVVDVSLVGSPIRDDAGHVTGVSVVARDISEQTRMARELSVLDAAVAASANAIVIADPEGKIVFANSAFTRLTGYSRAEAVGQTTRLLKSGAHPPSFYADLWQTILAGRVWSGEMTNRRKDGTLYSEEMTITPVLGNGSITHFIAIKQDVSARKTAETELRAALAKAVEGDRLKSAFLANMSHEVRTPLNIILGYNSLIAERLAEFHDETLHADLEAVAAASERLMHTIQGVIDLSRIETGMFEVQPEAVRLVPLLEEVVCRHRKTAQRKALPIVCDIEVGDVEIRFDRYCLRQALEHLFTNAVKFTERGGIRVRLHRGADAVLELSVSDSGVGIAESYLPHLFEPFSQQDVGSTRCFEGLGIGLALVKRYLELNATEISVASANGIGTTFSLRFPRSADPSGAEMPLVTLH